VRASRRFVYATSPLDGTITVVDARCWTVARVHALKPADEPFDIAVVSRRRAYVSARRATHLLRLDLETGTATQAVDLGPLADPDGVPDMGTLALHHRRLFVQLRRLDDEAGGFAPPAMLAVVDVPSETLVDVDPVAPGLQGIALEGTSPRFRMQVVPRTPWLFVSATGGFFDAGGIEAIDLRTLRSDGLVIREADGNVGADLGAFVMVAPDRGYLTYSTDLLLSSHLHEFTLAGAIGPELNVSLDYFVPALAHDRQSGHLFVPEGSAGETGVRVFDAATGTELTPGPTRTSGAPTDLQLVRRAPRACS
jgi:hypothetical protein